MNSYKKKIVSYSQPQKISGPPQLFIDKAFNTSIILFYLFFRVLLVPSPVLKSYVQFTDTCIIIDSRTYTTSVMVVQNNELISWKLMPIGGWYLSTRLYEAFCSRDNETALKYKVKFFF